MINALHTRAIRCLDRGELAQAEGLCRQILASMPQHRDARCNLALALIGLGRQKEAVVELNIALPQFAHLPAAQAAILSNLGVVYRDLGQFDEAESCYRQALARLPKLGTVWNNLGELCFLNGRAEEAFAHVETSRRLEPHNLMFASNEVFFMQFQPGIDAQAQKAALAEWQRVFGAPLQSTWRGHGNDRSAERRLRVGFISPDFQDHVIGHNMLPLFREMNRERVAPICYADVVGGDALTAEFRGHAELFRKTAGLAPEALAEQIRADGIDILVDLTLHLAGNRLVVFARKPAPVQVTFAGYPGSTGLGAMDYRLSDPYLDPVGMDESLYSEKTWRLPATFWCYDPSEGRGLEAGSLPALRNGHVTFGCLNNFCKVNDGVLQMWAKVLKEVMGSRLVLLADTGAHRERTWSKLEALGVARERVEFAARLPRVEYLKLYQRIDVGLDTVPYNGHTTSLDSFYMGVPVVTLVGKTVVGRAGLSQAMNLGMSELAAKSEEEFVDVARRLAGDLPGLAALRAGLRGRMEKSPLMDAEGFARGFEEALCGMWRTWCGT